MGVVFEFVVDVLPKLDLLFVAVLVGILGAGTLGGLARVKGVLLGCKGGVGGLPTRTPARLSESRGFLNMACIFGLVDLAALEHLHCV
jgi:hypothetical protein